MLNKIPVLDKGYVTMHSCSMTRNELLKVQQRYFKGVTSKQMLDMVHIHLEIRCPLFVQLSLSENLNCVSCPSAVEAFAPSVNDVGAKDLNTSETISEDIKRTTEALLLNPKAYQMDGCDIFISQVISPINVYNTLIVSGNLSQFIDYASKTGLPLPIDQYRATIKDILLSEYDYLWGQFGGEKKEKTTSGKKARKRV